MSGFISAGLELSDLLDGEDESSSPSFFLLKSRGSSPPVAADPAEPAAAAGLLVVGDEPWWAWTELVGGIPRTGGMTIVGTLKVTFVSPSGPTTGVAITMPCGVCAGGIGMEPPRRPCTGNAVPGGSTVPGGGTPAGSMGPGTPVAGGSTLSDP